jgi:predicted small lipoprotein YifL
MKVQGRNTIHAAALLLALAGCGGSGPAEDPAGSAPLPAADGVALDARDTATGANRHVLAIDGEGLRLFDVVTGSATPLPFGTGRDVLLGSLEPMRGPAERGSNAECGVQEYASWDDGLRLIFEDHRFAGWAIDVRSAGALTTASGIGPGSTRRDLENAYTAEVGQTTLGTEFTAGGFAGVLDGAGPDARITDMWAGVACIFR